ncbi:hypothetical protein [Jannaschia rubra]|uniref:Uncharacterized protein n=1 Tax=Jannaschia rubra TaxID=282197 RepID=A0A0M6XM94_9RHOB|nr:hypothetical protein [Jannaschia rubra]CTQ32209.1 hypothetical protein JAN5088_00972 [Jannaschia rubra]SFG34992.1 hypothetical protein SAMN04488517_10421 [Jannaschia rubra]
MASQTWMDRTIEATRVSEIVLPWTRRPAPVAAPDQTPQSAAIRARG